jgi:hypothetical protein
VGEVEGFPVVDGFRVDFAGDFVPGLGGVLERCYQEQYRKWYRTSRG